MRYTRLWISLGIVFIVSFIVLGYYGGRLIQTEPPIPKQVVTTDGTVLFTEKDIETGQNVWQSIGGQELGSIWGHGAYVAPDWTADWLHRESLWMLNSYAKKDYKKSYSSLNDETKAALRERLKKEIRKNTYNEETKEIVVTPYGLMRSKILVNIIFLYSLTILR